MTNLEVKIISDIEPIINKLGYILYDCIYEKEGENNYLNIYIDNDKCINIEDCEKVNNAIKDIIDKEESLKSQYFLVVSSPGVERKIRTDNQYSNNINKKIRIHLYNSIDNKKEIVGILKDFNENEILIVNDNKEIKIAKKMINLITTYYDWNEI